MLAELRRSAAYRIAFATAAAFALTILVLGGAVYWIAHNEFLRQQDRGLADESADLARVARDGGQAGVERALAARGRDRPLNIYGYALFDEAGQRVAGDMRTARPGSGVQTVTFLDPSEGVDTARGLATDLPGGRTLLVALDGEPLERIDRTILLLFGGALIAVLLASLGGALVLGATLRRRLERIGGTARAIAAGELDRRVPVGARGDEFDRLAVSLNAMLDRIVQLMDNLRQVSGDVAHDLRTPLARLRGGLDAALSEPPDPLRQRRALADAVDRSDELLSLFAAILRISEVEAGLRDNFAAFDLDELAAELCDSFAPAVADGGRTLSCHTDSGLIVDGDRALMAQAVVNLLDNAQAHTPEGTEITVLTDRNGTEMCVTVADDGPGVPPAERERITRRFVRLNGSRSTPGHGLGLNLVDAVARLHGGSIEVGDNAPGLRVTIRVPGIAA